MSRIKYYYDVNTCKYEKVSSSSSEVITRIIAYFFLTLLCSTLVTAIWINNFKSPEEYRLEKKATYLTELINRFDNSIIRIDNTLLNLEDRDANIYRSITGADSLPQAIRNPGIGGHNKHQIIKDLRLETGSLIINKLDKINQFKRRIKIQKKSYRDILIVADNKEKMLAAIPAIQPVSNKELKRLSSPWGMRYHPKLHVKKFHYGVDFSAPKGTPIYATADGKVKFTKNNRGGYGKEIEIDHGFGYRTKYAHMHSFTVKKGQRVKRGEQIGKVGSTGSSTAPHLHYEVICKNKKVDPIDFFFKDLNDEEYEHVLKRVSQESHIHE